MKKLYLFLRDGELFYGSSLDDQTALEVVSRELIADVVLMQEGQLYEVAKGWTVEIEDYRCPKCGYTHEDTIINGDHWMCTEKIPKRIKIARLVPDLSILESKVSGIAATGVPEYGEVNQEEFTEENWRQRFSPKKELSIGDVRRLAQEAINLREKEGRTIDFEDGFMEGFISGQSVSPLPQAESQEDSWAKVFVAISKRGLDKGIKESMEKFTITRNP